MEENTHSRLPQGMAGLSPLNSGPPAAAPVGAHSASLHGHFPTSGSCPPHTLPCAEALLTQRLLLR